MRIHPIRLFSISGLLKRKPGEDLSEKIMVNTAIMITLVAFLFMISGCSYYRAVTKVNESSGNLLNETVNKFYPEYDYPRDQYPESNLQKILFIDYNVIVIDSAGKWKLTEADIINDTIYAVAQLYPVPPDTIAAIPGDGISVRYHPKEEGDLLKRIFIYTEKVEFKQDGKICLPVKEISQIITFKDYPGMKVGMTFLIIGGIITITIITAIFLADPFKYE